MPLSKHSQKYAFPTRLGKAENPALPVPAHWFVERGFVETGIDVLPLAKQQLYNYQRRSKVFVKKIAPGI